MSKGSIGKALQYADFDAAGIYDELCRIILSKNPNLNDMLDFCKVLAADGEKFALSEELFDKFLHEYMEQGKNSRDSRPVTIIENNGTIEDLVDEILTKTNLKNKTSGDNQ